MQEYVLWVKENPVLSAAIQFAMLGTLGEFISYIIKTKSGKNFGALYQVLLKLIAWAVLGVIIKYGFTGMKGFVNNLLEHNLLPAFLKEGIGYAFAVSVITNVLFGPQMMAFHRFTDNLILKRSGFEGIQKAWFTLIWFWIPAHTVTFSLPVEYQIGLAAVWSLVLGLIMGLTTKK